MPVKSTETLLAGGLMVLAFSVTGCSTQARRVDCDGTLKPINRPAPAPPAPAKELTPSDEKPSHEK